MADTSIEWTDATWNPVAGCTVLSPGCTNCYAMRMAAQLEAMGTEKYRGLTRKSGKRAVTHVRPLEHFGSHATLVACRLETGRTHQIRVHLADAGTPILGDALYGKLSKPGYAV